MLPRKYIDVLRRLYSELEDSKVTWAVTGSVSFCLQGMPVNPDDIDIQTDEPGAYEMERLFRENLVEEVEFSSTGQIRSHFGAFKIDGILVEVMGAIQKFHEDEWEDPVNIDKHKRLVVLKEMEIPVLDLSYEAEAYRKLGRLGKAEQLKRYSETSKPGNFLQ